MSTVCSACGSSSTPAELLMLLRTLPVNEYSHQVSDESVSKENRENCGHGVGGVVEVFTTCMSCKSKG